MQLYYGLYFSEQFWNLYFDTCSQLVFFLINKYKCNGKKAWEYTQKVPWHKTFFFEVPWITL